MPPPPDIRVEEIDRDKVMVTFKAVSGLRFVMIDRTFMFYFNKCRWLYWTALATLRSRLNVLIPRSTSKADHGDILNKVVKIDTYFESLGVIRNHYTIRVDPEEVSLTLPAAKWLYRKDYDDDFYEQAATRIEHIMTKP